MGCIVQLKFLRLFLRGILIVSILLGLIFFDASPAMATISTVEEAPGQFLYKSKHQLRDSGGKAWQIVLFKRVKANNSSPINLRLVGFPGTVNFSHPQPLKFITKIGNYQAEDMFAGEAPASNVGQYDVTNILSRLPNSASINLAIQMEDNRVIKLKIPPEIILEWQIIALQSLPIASN